jgi:hypothetical protein
VSSRIIGELNVPDARQVILDGSGDVAFHHLHVVDVILQREIAVTDLIQQLQRVPGAGEVEAGHIAGIKCLDDQGDALFFQGGGGETQVIRNQLAHLIRGHVLGSQPH